MRSRKGFLQFLGVVLATLFVIGSAGSAWGASEAELKQLMEIIKQQQAQIEVQAQALEDLKQKVETLSQEAEKTKATAEEVASKVEAVEKAGTLERVVQASSSDVDVHLYGQVNRAALYSDDGNQDNWYFVDNSNSSTRFGMRVRGHGWKDLSMGGRIEVEFQSNDSNKVNQFEKSGVGQNNFRTRWLDFDINTSKFGRLFLGRGDTASNNTSETDLSGTTVVGDSAIGDMAGGQLFYNKETQSYDLVGDDPSTGTNIKSVFDNLDGLSREDRIRYDTPEFYGFSGAVSAVSDGAYDFSLWYSGEFLGVKLAASASYVKPNALRPTHNDQYSGSISALHSSGINLSFAGGQRDFKDTDGDPDRDDSKFWYGKIGYRRKFFPMGDTRFSADYGEYKNMIKNDDKATTFGIQIVQMLDRWGTEYYLGYRFHNLDRKAADADFKSIYALMSGFRIKF